MTVFALILGALCLTGIVATVRALLTDGYRAVPTRGKMRTTEPAIRASLPPRDQLFIRRLSTLQSSVGDVTERG